MTNFPSQKRDWSELKSAMNEARSNDLIWNNERVFKPAYFAGDDVLEVAHESYHMYINENALYSKTSYPSLYQYETELIDMLVDLLNGPDGSGGSFTSGGTESNLVAMKTAREWAKEHQPGSGTPEIVVPRTAHPSFEKGATVLEMKVVRLQESPNLTVDLAAMEKAINANTIMLVGSAPPYNYGHTDPITVIGAMAQQHGLWMHVDSCLGGFILPFAREFDSTIPEFDFSVSTVRSISVDLHKYAYSAKGISALMLRNKTHADYNRTSFNDWPGGLYSTPNLSGSRSGGAIASAWAVINYLGREGYRNIVQDLIQLRQKFQAGINAIPGLRVVGTPQTFQFAFGSDQFDIYAVADAMEDLNWKIGRAREPHSIQLMINSSHHSTVTTFLSDLEKVSDRVAAGNIKARDIQSVYAN